MKAANRRIDAGMQKRRAIAEEFLYRGIFVYDTPTAHAPHLFYFQNDFKVAVTSGME